MLLNHWNIHTGNVLPAPSIKAGSHREQSHATQVAFNRLGVFSTSVHTGCEATRPILARSRGVVGGGTVVSRIALSVAIFF